MIGPTTRIIPDASSSFVRSTSYESIQRAATEDDEKKRQAKLRNRACNDSFRQAVDKSYCQNNHDGKIISISICILKILNFRFSK